MLIVDTSLRKGFAHAFVAGAGAATADLLYAALAVVGGVALSQAVGSAGDWFRVASALVLMVIALRGFLRARGEANGDRVEPGRSGRNLGRTYLQFVGLTVINPTTIVYFAAVIIGLGVADDFTTAQGLLFTLGAGLASLSWQTLLAGVGSAAGHRLGTRARTLAALGGNLVVLGLGLLILVQALA